MSNKDKYINKIFESKNYGKFKVIDYVNSKNVTVEFLKTGYKTKARAFDIRKGNVKDAFSPNVYGIGFIGRKKSRNGDEKTYRLWQSMLERSYSDKHKRKHPSYKYVSVCKEWHNYQIFYKWCEENMPNTNTLLHIDKDLLFNGNDVYSPNHVCFLPIEINLFLTNEHKNKRDLPIGVYKIHNRYVAKIYNNKKEKHIGTFDTSEQAHEEYLKEKRKQALALVDKYNQILTKKAIHALISRY